MINKEMFHKYARIYNHGYSLSGGQEIFGGKPQGFFFVQVKPVLKRVTADYPTIEEAFAAFDQYAFHNKIDLKNKTYADVKFKDLV